MQQFSHLTDEVLTAKYETIEAGKNNPLDCQGYKLKFQISPQHVKFLRALSLQYIV